MEVKRTYDEDFIIEECLECKIDKAEKLLGYPRCDDEGYDDGCTDGSYTMYRSYEKDADGFTLKLYYNSKNNVVYDFKIYQ
jgi:hypothetical protein